MQSGVCADVTAAPGLRDRVEPLALTAAVAWLFVLACLALWSLGPLVVGWRPAVVITGSMLPTISPGDVVVFDPGATGLRRGEIVLVREPSQPSGRVAHRVVEVKGNGDLVTKGDANPTADRTARRPRDVVGRVRLVVPAAGRLAMLRHGPSRGDLAWAAVAVLACLTLGLVRPVTSEPGLLREDPQRMHSDLRQYRAEKAGLPGQDDLRDAGLS